MLNCFTTEKPDNIIPIHLVTQRTFTDWQKVQHEGISVWLNATQFRPEPNAVRLIPHTDGTLARVICCIDDMETIWSAGGLPLMLPEGVYELDVPANRYEDYAIGWGLGAYQFTRYKKASRMPAKLYVPHEWAQHVENAVSAAYLVRDLINTPTDDMGPKELAGEVQKLARKFDAQFTQIVGDELLEQNYACIHTVGRASDDAPRLLDLRWGDPSHPKLTLVGKGVCFDTGGLDIKGSSYMLLMKKDMGGAAHVLGLARMLMQAKLPICLRVLIPAVENSVSGNAYRPGDIIKSRKGLTIEVGNTDAEGRVVLADALAEAASEEPELIIDIATLTGAARVALGTDVAAMFANDDDVANALIEHAERNHDPIWRLPLFAGYRESLNSTIADINNNAVDGYGGAITAALFLKEFVPNNIPWVHFDLMAWNLRPRPGRPVGGEAMALRALFSYLLERYGGSIA